ncbi:HNH endonuclease [Corynebacterium amycolatum]|uniref:HNH endonuclease n=1 Tax=Corynebacterium amycolatum TaxID=43765 RepID=UPI003D77D1FF
MRQLRQTAPQPTRQPVAPHHQRLYTTCDTLTLSKNYAPKGTPQRGIFYTQKQAEATISRTGNRQYRQKRAQLLAGDNLTCARCGLPIDKTLKFPDPFSATADHITPVAAGGHNLGPLQPMHLSCNQAEGAKGHRAAKVKPRHVRNW